MNDDFNFIRISEETQAQFRRLAQQRAVPVSDIVQEAMSEYLQTRETGANYINVIQNIESALREAGQFATSADPSGLVLFIKSPLRRVHRPELKYEVRIRHGDRSSVGRFNVVLRSHDMETIRSFTEFVNLWIELERNYLTRNQAGQAIYWTDADYFGRQIFWPMTEDGEQLVGEAISNYIYVFDELLKYHFANWSYGQSIEPLYLARLAAGKLTI